jgi:hypothetical protein
MLTMTTMLLACKSEPATLVGATLDDGQILVGEVTTGALALESPLGEVVVPLQDVGMVLPVERRTLADSHNHVTVWLRDGSELNGKWTAPELEMAIAAGGRRVAVELPTERLQTVQLRGAEAWPDVDRYRVRTVWGDDFLVDPTKTLLSLDSDLGRFDLTLAECERVGPVGAADGPWRVELATGTVLIGKPSAELELVPAMGPDAVVVPVTGLVALTRGGWSEADAIEVHEVAMDMQMMAPAAAVPPPDVAGQVASGEAVAVDVPEEGEAEAEPEEAQRAQAGLSSSAGWFDNARLSSSKR